MAQTSEERLAKQRLYYVSHREETAARSKRYRTTHHEELCEKAKIRRLKNIDKYREKNKQWGRDNSDKVSARHKIYNQEHKEELSAKRKAFYREHAEEKKAYARRYSKINRLAIRKMAIGHYGGKCACCGESTYEFLSIDHIDGGGNKHRKEINSKGGWAFATWLKKNDYPEGFQVLCHNCNMAKGCYSKCPHEEMRKNA